MKKFLTVAAIALAVGMGATGASAQSFTGQDLYNMIQNGKNPTIDADWYQIEVRGYNARAYEWETANNPDYFCIAIFTKAGPVGLQCMPKAGVETNE